MRCEVCRGGRCVTIAKLVLRIMLRCRVGEERRRACADEHNACDNAQKRSARRASSSMMSLYFLTAVTPKSHIECNGAFPCARGSLTIGNTAGVFSRMLRLQPDSVISSGGLGLGRGRSHGITSVGPKLEPVQAQRSLMSAPRLIEGRMMQNASVVRNKKGAFAAAEALTRQLRATGNLARSIHEHSFTYAANPAMQPIPRFRPRFPRANFRFAKTTAESRIHERDE